MKEIEELISDFKRRGWKSEPMDKALNIARSLRTDAARLAHQLVDELPQGTTFHDAVLSFVSLEEWPELIRHAIKAFARSRKNESAEAVFQYGSLQCIHALHPHLQELFELSPNAGTYCETWPWRASNRVSAEHLLAIATDPSQSAQRRRKAWMCMLQTRQPDIVRSALDHQKHIDLNLQMRQHGLPESLTATEYLHDVGFEEQELELRQLYANGVRHLVFGESYWTRSRPAWQRRENHPTWLAPRDSATQRIDVGGDGSAICGRCGNRMHRLLRFPSTEDLPLVTGLEELTLETCLSCLGWEQPRMFYRHADNGLPACLSTNGNPPQFPAVALKPTEGLLVDQGVRWHWQDWASANSRENLHRIGGHPTWIQSSEYPQCPKCKATMPFLLQLDSDLPTTDDGEWPWGSGGILYVFWCNSCSISGMLWQCT